MINTYFRADGGNIDKRIKSTINKLLEKRTFLDYGGHFLHPQTRISSLSTHRHYYSEHQLH